MKNLAHPLSAEALLTAPGSIHELETALVDGRLYRVYKNLWSSLRDFWLSAVSQYADDTYIVYEDQRLTYGQVHTRSVKIAGLLRTVYSIKKGSHPRALAVLKHATKNTSSLCHRR